MNQYKLKVKTSVGDILRCKFYSPLPMWEICKMYEDQCHCEILKIEKVKVKQTTFSPFLIPTLSIIPKSYNL